MKRESNISLIEAVETLSSIADLEVDRDIGVAEKHDIVVQDEKVTYRTVHWLQKKDAGETINGVREIFRVILNYLRNFYKNEYTYVTNEHAIEGIKTIMVLVGEAAKKLDKYTTLFQQNRAKSVTELKEYKKLQEFYFSKIARKIDEGILGKWILGLTQKLTPSESQMKLIGRKSNQTKHIFVDLESVKKDTEYELFCMRKEDGTRFFSPRLIRNIKLVSDFGVYFGETIADDPLSSLEIWQDRCFNSAAKTLARAVRPQIEMFYHESMKFRDRELIAEINKALMALMLCCNQGNLLRNNPIKSCFQYFVDFQFFLRNALHSREFQKLLAYPPKASSKLAHCVLDTVNALCRGLFIQLQGMQELIPAIQGLIEEAVQTASVEKAAMVENHRLMWDRLNDEYDAMAKLFKRHPNGPLVKVIDILENGTYNCFDPIGQHNIPNQLFSLYVHEHRITNVRIPSPTYQEFIHKVIVTEEFRTFLRACSKGNELHKHLMINMQDRTSWREHFRSVVLEDLSTHQDFSRVLTVVTLAYDTEFYHQLAPYHRDNQSAVFIKHLKDHLQDESSGFYFPKALKKALFPEFVNEVIDAIHRIFFNDKNVLSRERRLDFIEIFYLFLNLKLIELVKPDSFSLTCKDGVDIGSIASVEMFAFLKLLSEEKLSDVEMEQFHMMLYGPAILFRERLPHPERFNRMVSAMKTIEFVRQEKGYITFSKIVNEVFGRYYKMPIIHAKVACPK